MCQDINTKRGTDDPTEKSAVADVNDPMHQLDGIGDTTEQLVKRSKQMPKRNLDVAQRVSMAETFGTTQLRTVRVLRSHMNSFWVHEEDAPWLVSYVAS